MLREKNEKGKETHSTFFLLKSNEEKSVSGKYQGNLMLQANCLPSDFTLSIKEDDSVVIGLWIL